MVLHEMTKAAGVQDKIQDEMLIVAKDDNSNLSGRYWLRTNIFYRHRFENNRLNQSYKIDGVDEANGQGLNQ